MKNLLELHQTKKNDKDWKVIKKTVNGFCFLSQYDAFGHVVTKRISNKRYDEIKKELTKTTKAYVFKMNGHVVDLKTVENCLQYEQDWCDLFVLKRVECEDCSSDNSEDIITVEEVEVS